HAGERELHPENGGGEIDGGDGRGVASEVEHREDERGEHHGRDEGRARAELEHQVFTRHRPRLHEQFTHRPPPAGTPRRSRRAPARPAARNGRTVRDAGTPRRSRARPPRPRCASPARARGPPPPAPPTRTPPATP